MSDHTEPAGMSKQSAATISDFTKERNEALQSLDEKKIRAMLLKWHGDSGPVGDQVFWCAVHKAITAIPGLPLEFRKASKKWLRQRDYKSMDDGDL